MQTQSIKYGETCYKAETERRTEIIRQFNKESHFPYDVNRSDQKLS